MSLSPLFSPQILETSKEGPTHIRLFNVLSSPFEVNRSGSLLNYLTTLDLPDLDTFDGLSTFLVNSPKYSKYFIEDLVNPTSIKKYT